MPREEEIGKAYKNYYTHQNNIAKKNRPFRQAYDYIKKGYLSWRFGYSTAQSTCQKLLGTLLFMHPYRRTTIDREMMFLKYRPGGVLLDVGCGSGEKMALFQSLGWQTAGIDLDELAIMQARKKGLEVRSGSLQEQHYPDAYFDAIIMDNVIEHVFDPVGILQECHRILKPQGILVAVTPNVESLGHRVFGASWRGLEPPRHLYLFTGAAVKRVMKNGRFQKCSVSTSAAGAAFIYSMSRDCINAGDHGPKLGRIILERCGAKIAFGVEWGLLKLRSYLGEELIIIAQK